MNQDQIRQYLRFYRDLGFEEIYRREAPIAAAGPEALPAPAERPMPDISRSLFSQAGPCGETVE